MNDIANAPAAPPPGWYQDPGTGHQRWWDGTAWGQFAPPTARPVVFIAPPKDTTAAYLLAIFLGGLGAHNFYLRNTGAAVAQLILTCIGVLTSWLVIGLVPLFAVGVWVIVDLFLIPERIRNLNSGAVGA